MQTRFSRNSGRLRPLAVFSAAALLCTALAPVMAQTPKLTLTERSLTSLSEEARFTSGLTGQSMRYRGLMANVMGRDRDAVDNFELAARHADKLSQHYLSLIHWYGQGVPADRALAYIWSDMAAERGHRRLLALREKMWSELTDAERARVVELGPAMYREYGDPTSKARMEQALVRFASSKTGSRLGYNSQRMDIVYGVPGTTFNAGAPPTLGQEGGSRDFVFYADARVRPEAYWQAQDQEIERGFGRISVGEIVADDADGASAPSDAPSSEQGGGMSPPRMLL